jgi:triacylglycerol lipase
MNKKLLLTFLAVLLSGISLQSYAACSKQPVIFVHGYAGFNAQWNTMSNRFKNDGWPDCALYKFSYSSLTKSNKTSATELRDYVNWVKGRTGWSKVNIVAHSNGGLVSRWYRVFKNGAASNDDLVTIGTPHKGTSWAYACFSPACFEMRYNSSFLKDLNGRGCDTSIWSSGDEIINPDSSAQCGSNHHVGWWEHNIMLELKSTYNIVKGNI